MKPPESASPFIVLVSKGEMLKVQHEGAAKLVIESEEAGAHLVGPVCCTLFGINKYWIALYEGPVCRFPPKTPLSLWQSFIPPGTQRPWFICTVVGVGEFVGQQTVDEVSPGSSPVFHLLPIHAFYNAANG